MEWISEEGGNAVRRRVELWDADDVDPGEALRWPPVRVVRYRQPTPEGTIVEADGPPRQVGSLSLSGIATSRGEMETQGFTDAKTRDGMEHRRHHHDNSVLGSWLLFSNSR